MGSRKCVCHLQRDRQSTFQGQWSTVHQLSHIASFDVLHGNKMDATDVIEIEDGADVGVVQGRSETGFAFKAL